MPRFVFNFGEVFPADDVLSEWVATLALAFNDVSLVRNKLVDDETSQYRWLYWHRLGIAHFAEAASYLSDTAEIPEVEAFVASLDLEVQDHYRDCLLRYEKNESVIERIRNEAGFHYPELKIVPGRRSRRPIQRVLAALGDQTGEITAGGTIREGRILFADTVAASLVAHAIGGDEALKSGPAEYGELIKQVALEIEQGVASFARFANGAIDKYLVRRAEDDGVTLRSVASNGAALEGSNGT